MNESNNAYSDEPLHASEGSQSLNTTYVKEVASSETRQSYDAASGIVHLQDVVVDCSNNIRHANVLNSLPHNVYCTSTQQCNCQFSSENQCLNFCTDANYENYPVEIHSRDTNEQSALQPGCLSPSSLERSVTREFDERLNGMHEVDVTQNVSDLQNSPRNSSGEKSSLSVNTEMELNNSTSYSNRCNFSQRSNSELRSIIAESDRSTSILRAVDKEVELTAVTDNDLKIIGISPTSPSSIYSSENNTSSSNNTTIEVSRTSFHRPAMTNVGIGVVKKIPSIRRKRKSDIVVQAKTSNDYENVYNVDENEYSSALREISEPTKELGNTNISRLTGSETTSPSLPLPLPPRTYILRYPYSVIPKTLGIPIVDNSRSMNSSHDYENLPPINVHRAMLGVRHWKNYLDIESRVHDNSTQKDKSKIDSTTMSSINSEFSIVKTTSKSRPMSIAEDGESILARSLPDLSNLVLEACIEVPEEGEKLETASEAQASSTANALPDNTRILTVLEGLRSKKPARSNSVDNLSNYETLWVGDVDGNYAPLSEVSSIITNTQHSSEHSTLIHTIGDVKKKGSLCNLYYSTMSDLSRRFYNETLRIQPPGHQMNGNFTGEMNVKSTSGKGDKIILQKITESEEGSHKGDNMCADATLVDVIQPQCIKTVEEPVSGERPGEELPKASNQVCGSTLACTPNVKEETVAKTRRKFSVIRDKFDGSRWTPLKSPLKSPAKALQAGIKVFNKPKVHIITQSKDSKGSTGRKFISPFRSRCFNNNAPSINANIMDNIEVKIKRKDDGTEERFTVTRTPLKPVSTTPSSVRTIMKTPKTSTPDNHKSKSDSCNPSSTVTNNESGVAPKHSTPEGAEKHLPQVSVISGLSSVVESPELSRISSMYGVPRHIISNSNLVPRRIPLSENVRPDLVRTSGGRVVSNGIDRNDEDSSINQSSIRRNVVYRNMYSPLDDPRLMYKASQGSPYLNSETCKMMQNLEKYKENLILCPSIPISYGIGTSQRSTLSPNSKIFNRKI